MDGCEESLGDVDVSACKTGTPGILAAVLRPLILFGALLALGACETHPSHRFLTKPEQAALGTIDGVLAVPDRDPAVTITPTSTGGAGGIAGIFVVAVIDGIRSARAQSDAAPIRAALQGFDFQAELLAALTTKLEALPNVKVAMRPTTIVSGNSADAARAYAESQDTSVLLMNARYSLESGDLVISLGMALYPKSEELKRFRPKPNDKDPLALGNALFHIRPVVKKNAVTAANIRTAVSDAIEQLARSAAATLRQAN